MQGHRRRGNSRGRGPSRSGAALSTECMGAADLEGQGKSADPDELSDRGAGTASRPWAHIPALQHVLGAWVYPWWVALFCTRVIPPLTEQPFLYFTEGKHGDDCVTHRSVMMAQRPLN